MIGLNQICKRYDTRSGQHTVLDGIDLAVGFGERVGILGRNGSGKSTLIRILSGAERPTSGTIDRRMSVSWPLAFGGGFHGSLTGIDNIKFICRIYGTDYRNKLEFVENFTELGKYLNEPVHTYSSGMQSRLAFAISMVIEFDCFLVDEGMSVGDSRFHDRCREELFHKRGDRAMILVSHDASTVREICHRASVLFNAKLHHFADVESAYAFYNENC